jgi:Phage tail sheath protein subtilisin-like domain/Phage tail sheath C-terminal domain
MATLRQIQSPGVQINEIDLSQRTSAPTGTSVFITGFAPQGPANEIVNLTSKNDFANIFGTPTNAAERYFYYSVQQQFNAGTNAQVSVYRLPYGGGMGDGYATNKYSALVFPVVAASAGDTVSHAATRSIYLSSADTYYLGAPELIQLTQDDYTTLKQNGIQWSGSSSSTAPVIQDINSLSGNGIGLIVINEAQTTINEKFEGLYLNIADNSNLSPTTDYKAVRNVYTITTDYQYFGLNTGTYYQTIPTDRLSFQLSATYTDLTPSISQLIENIPQYNISSIGGSGFDDLAIVSLFKVRTSPFGNNPLELSYSLQEGYATSFYSNRTVQDKNGGAAKSDYIETVINNASSNLTVLLNPNIANNTNWLDGNGNAQKHVRVLTSSNVPAGYGAANNLFPLGVYAPSLDTTTTKPIGDVGAKLDVALALASNADVYNIDVVVDAGLSTIAAIANNGVYDDTAYSSTISAQIDALTSSDGSYAPGMNDKIVPTWKQITQKFIQFTTYQRKDCIFISDPLRQIFVQGANFKTLNDHAATFSNNIYWPLRNTYTDYNTSYATTYGNWVKIIDSFTSKVVWLPFSGYAAAIYTNNDAVAYPWAAPAGATRGTVTGVVDIAVNPNQKQRDLLYKIAVNPVVNQPGAGISIQGQKTLLQTPSAFDRINVRRLFLFLEKSVLATSKSFLFEPNTTFTRNRLINTINPVFSLAKNSQGVYDYLLVCNDTNNTPDVVDDNSLVIDIYIKPVRTAEFILVNFYCTKTSQNFQELTQ